MKLNILKIAIPGLMLFMLAGCGTKKSETSREITPKTLGWSIFRGDTQLSGLTGEHLPGSMQRVWTFKTGEKATNQFATLHEMRDGKIAKWSDYWDVSGFVGQFPAWFLEHMAKHSQADFSD